MVKFCQIWSHCPQITEEVNLNYPLDAFYLSVPRYNKFKEIPNFDKLELYSLEFECGYSCQTRQNERKRGRDSDKRFKRNLKVLTNKTHNWRMELRQPRSFGNGRLQVQIPALDRRLLYKIYLFQNCTQVLRPKINENRMGRLG